VTPSPSIAAPAPLASATSEVAIAAAPKALIIVRMVILLLVC
jgi:hypothetical protein